MEAEVFTIATRSTPGFVRLLRSVAKFGVHLTILARNEARYFGGAWRWKQFIQGVKASRARIVIHCDAYDTVCLEPLGCLLEKFAGSSHAILFSYEDKEQPQFWLGLQPGLMMANREALLAAFTDQILNEFFPDHFSDQQQIQTLYSWKPDSFILDKEGAIFYTLGRRSPELVVNRQRLVHPVTGLSPSFVHGPHRWDMSKIEQWIANIANLT